MSILNASTQPATKLQGPQLATTDPDRRKNKRLARHRGNRTASPITNCACLAASKLCGGESLRGLG